MILFLRRIFVRAEHLRASALCAAALAVIGVFGVGSAAAVSAKCEYTRVDGACAGNVSQSPCLQKHRDIQLTYSSRKVDGWQSC